MRARAQQISSASRRFLMHHRIPATAFFGAIERHRELAHWCRDILPALVVAFDKVMVVGTR